MANGGTPYQRAQLAARERVQSLDRRAARQIQAELDAHAKRLGRLVSRIPPGASRDRMLATQRLFEQSALEFNSRVQTLIATNRALSYSDVLQTWQKSANQIATLEGIPANLLGAVNNPPVSLLGIYENVGGAGNWRTLMNKNVRMATREANTIVRNAIVQGISPRELASRLRPYVSGAESFQKSFRTLKDGQRKRIDLRTITDPELRGAARRAAFNAKRIAWSEIHNARAEAEVQHFAADPLIAAVRWELAPDRGTQTEPDECDVLATSDFWGLGVGLYPVDQVPLPPHPFDRCERVPVTADELREGEVTFPDSATSQGRDRKNAVSFGRIPKGVDASTGQRSRRLAERAMSEIPPTAHGDTVKLITSVGEVPAASSAKAFARAMIQAGVPEAEGVGILAKHFPKLKNPKTQWRRAKKQVLEAGGGAPPPKPTKPPKVKTPGRGRTVRGTTAGEPVDENLA